jgi:multimeric flavodoxin WrbA
MHQDKYILLFNASPRKGGNTDIILERIQTSIGERAKTEKIYINDLKFKPCQECAACQEGLSCTLDDDLRPLYKRIADSDAIIFGSPIYFGSVSAQAKMFIDRMQPFWIAKVNNRKLAPKIKKGFLVLVSGASKESFFENARQIVKCFFEVVNARYCGQLFFAKIDKKGEILDFPGLTQEAARIAEAALSQ